MYSSSLLAHLTENFAPHPENVATEALGHILAHSVSARHALNSILTGTGISQDLAFRTLQTEGDDALARPDLTGRDDQGRNVVLIGAKFWAGLTDNQPKLLIARLNKEDPEHWIRNLKLTHNEPNELIQQLQRLQALEPAPAPTPLGPGTLDAEAEVMPWE